MSVEAVKTIPPQFNFQEEVVYPFPVQGESVNFSRYTFDNISNTNASVSLNTPGITQNVLSRNAYKQVKLRLSYTVTASGTALNTLAHQSILVCPRRFPISAITSVESVQLNNFTNTLNLSQVVDPLSRYDKFDEYNDSIFPSIVQADDTQNYDSTMVISSNSPFNTAPLTREQLQPRNSYPYAVISNPLCTSGSPTQTVTLDYTFYEPVMCSPFQMGSANDKSLAWVNTLNYQLTFGNLTRAFSFMQTAYCTSLGYAISNISVQVMEAVLYLKWLTLPAGMNLPDSIVYNYNRIDVYPQVIRDVYNADVVGTINFNSTSLRTVPSDAYLLINKTYNQTTPQDADAYIPINTISIGWGNLQNQLANNTAIDNLRLLKENGLKASNLSQSMMLYSSTNKNYVSTGNSQITYRFASQPFKLKFTKDVLASDGMTIGASDTSTFTASLNFTNCTGATMAANTYSLTLLTVTPMQFVIGKYDNPQIGSIITPSQADALPATTLLSEELAGSGLLLGGSLLGGSFWSKLKGVARTAARTASKGLKKGVKILDEGDKYVQALAGLSPETAMLYENVRNAGHALTGGQATLHGSGMLTDAEKKKLIRSAQKGRYLR